MIDNISRKHLVTTFHCTDCGGALSLSYSASKDADRMIGRDDKVGMTGADVCFDRVLIEPCKTCIGAARKPLQQMREALASLTEKTNA